MGNILAKDYQDICKCCSSHRSLVRSADSGEHYARPLFGESRYLGPIRSLEANDIWCPNLKQPTNDGSTTPSSPSNDVKECPKVPASKEPSTTPVMGEHNESSDDSDEEARNSTPIQRLVTSVRASVKVSEAFLSAGRKTTAAHLRTILSESDAASSPHTYSPDEAAPAWQKSNQKKHVGFVDDVMRADDVDDEPTDDVDDEHEVAGRSSPDQIIVPQSDEEQQQGPAAVQEEYELLDTPNQTFLEPSFEERPLPKLKTVNKLQTMNLDDFLGPTDAAPEAPVAKPEAPVRAHSNKPDVLAKQLGGMFSKYPRGGKGFFSGIQVRYFALVKAPSGWSQGALGYWESEDEYRRDSEKKNAKGIVKLFKISQIRMAPDIEDGTCVRIKYKDGDEFTELVIIHKTVEDAEWWCDGLKKFVTLLRKDKQVTK